jgi:hypothetical protein
MTKIITPDIVSKNNANNISIISNSKPVITEQPTKEQTDFDYFPLTISIIDPALNASNPSIHSDSQSQNNCCLCCACFICFIPAIVVDIISCPSRLCYNKFF